VAYIFSVNDDWEKMMKFLLELSKVF